MNQLWAPWRMEFIQEEKRDGCIFCILPAETKDRDNLILHRGEHSFVILNKYPYSSGHLMVVPYLHTIQMGELTAETHLEMMHLVDLSMKVITESMQAQGYNVGLNLGKAAGAGVPGHMHFHVVPRWIGDFNFMPILSETKVMLEYLHATYDRLKPFF